MFWRRTRRSIERSIRELGTLAPVVCSARAGQPGGVMKTTSVFNHPYCSMAIASVCRNPSTIFVRIATLPGDRADVVVAQRAAADPIDPHNQAAGRVGAGHAR